jgi:hypothetical protein
LDDGTGATAAWAAGDTAAFAAGTDATGIYTVNGTKDARTATVRKMAEPVWMVWTERRCYYGARHER